MEHLSGEQLWQVCVRAEDMRYALPADAIDRKFYSTGPYRISRRPPNRNWIRDL